jgi:cytochrome c
MRNMKGFEMQFQQVPLHGVVTTLLLLSSGFAQANPDLAKKHNCTACHAVDKKVIGPAYVDVAKKFKGQADAAAKLTKSVKAGSAGVWGPIPMPPNPGVADADIKTLVDWVLAQAK